MIVMKRLLCAVLLTGTVAPPAFAAPDGTALARQNCASCHTLGKGDPPGEGPNLYGVVGRRVGSSPGFNYSPGLLRALRGQTWTPLMLDRWLADTQKLAPNAGMIYFNDDKAERAAIIAYLSRLKP
jgi:cytochrome c